jgi:hypothetical protein
MTAKYLLPHPPFVDGAGMTEFMRRAVEVQQSDVVYGTDASTGGTTVALFEVPKDTLILRVIAHKKVAYAKAGSQMKVGFSGSDDHIFNDTTLNPVATGVVNSAPYLSTGIVTINAILTSTGSSGAAETAGQFDFYVEYIPLGNRLPQLLR